MDNLEIWISRSTQGRSKDGLELAAYGFLLAPHTTWALTYDRLATTRYLWLFSKMDDLEL